MIKYRSCECQSVFPKFAIDHGIVCSPQTAEAVILENPNEKKNQVIEAVFEGDHLMHRHKFPYDTASPTEGT